MKKKLICSSVGRIKRAQRVNPPSQGGFTRCARLIHPTRLTLILAALYPTLCIAEVQDLSQDQVAQALGWINQPKANTCGGYYVEPDLGNQDADVGVDTNQNQPITISADATDLHPDNLSTLTGNVVSSQPGRLIQSQKATFIRDPQTKKIKAVDYYGDVIVREPSKVALGDHVHFVPGSDQGIYDDVIYRMALNMQPINLLEEDDSQYKVQGLIAQGKASQIDQTRKGYYVLKNANYSTCSPQNTSWHLHAKQIDLNHDTGRGTAHSATVYFKKMPVFYTPYLNFPIDKRRQTGFLSPSYGNSSEGGFSLSFPFYWNMAPNYDMNITPTWYSKRGIYTETRNRFLTSSSNGEVDTGILPEDEAFHTFRNNGAIEYANNPAVTRLMNDNDTRWYYRLKDTTNFSPNLQGKVDYTRAGDDYIQEDFGLPMTQPTSGQLLQQASLRYSSLYWDSALLAQQYQTLHPVNMLGNGNQYARLPDLTFNLNYPVNQSINYLLSAEAVDFSRQLNPGEVLQTASGDPTDGLRTNVQPGLGLNWMNAFSYIKPTMQWELTEYDLANQTVGYSTQITRSLPIFNIDSGMYFDRDTTLFSHDYDETLEPRLFYLYVPYRDQYQIPVFDSGIPTFNYSQLFQTNRFSSIDRIGDANQITAAVSTHFIDKDSGADKASFGVGRIYYSQDRKVMLCGQYGCQDSPTSVGITSSTEPASPLAGFANYALNAAWNTSANLAWDPRTHHTNNGNVNLQYLPKINHVINLTYNFVQYGDTYSPTTTDPTDRRNNLNQIGTSAAWPLTHTIDAMAAVNYNISHEHFQTYLYGLSYNACCYAVRVATTRVFSALNGNGVPQFDRQILLQFVLKGFGGVGQTSTLNTLTSWVPGYQDTFNQNVY